MKRSLRSTLIILTLAIATTGFVAAREAGAARGSVTVRPDRSPTREAVPEYLSGTVIIKLRPDVLNRRGDARFGIAELDALLDRIGADDRRPLFPFAPIHRGAGDMVLEGEEDHGFERIYVISYSSVYDARWVAEQATKTNGVEIAEPYYIFRSTYTPNDSRLASQAWLSTIQAREAWDIIKGDNTIVIAICDSGVEWNHEDLAASIFTNGGESGRDGQGRDKSTNGVDDDDNGYVDDWHGWDFVGAVSSTDALVRGQYLPDNNPAPVNAWQEHGTAVAGCAAGISDNGVGIASPAFRAKILPIKLSSDPINTEALFAGYDGIRYAADMGAHIINCSWGGPGNASSFQIVQSVIDYARSKGALVIGASGNSGSNNDVTPFFPANLRGVLSVGATTGLDSVAGYSDYGSTVRIFAPGNNVSTTGMGLNGGYAAPSGTSFSAPIVSGVAALVYAMHPDWTPDQVAMQLRVTGDRVKVRSERSAPLAYRRVNAFRAVAVNRNLADEDPSNLPGIGLDSYTINGKAIDTLKSLTGSVEVRLKLTNYLAPTSNLTISAMPDQSLTLEETTLTVGRMETMQSVDAIDVGVKVNPSARTIYSEGTIALTLLLRDGSYQDLVTINVPVNLPGWHQQFDPYIDNTTQIYAGSSIHAVSSKIAWGVANTGSQQSGTPWFTRTLSGKTWAAWRSITTAQEPVYCITALSDKLAWAGTGPTSGQTAIYRTTNGGSVWQRTSVSNITNFVDAVHFFDSTNGILIGDPIASRWGIATTSDGGATWLALARPLATTSSAEAGWNNSFAVHGDNLWFGTNVGRIYRSTDRGRTWTFATTPAPNSLALAFLDAERGMAIFRTTTANGGRNAVSVSSNGGASWTEVSLPFTGAEPDGVIFIPGTERAVIGTQLGLYESADFGATWAAVPMPPIQPTGMTFTAAADPDGSVTAFATNVYSQISAFKHTVTAAVSDPDDADERGTAVRLGAIVPNPFSGVATVTYELQAPTEVELTLHDMSGRQVMLLASEAKMPGRHEAILDATSLPAGGYIVVLRAGENRIARQAIVIR